MASHRYTFYWSAVFLLISIATTAYEPNGVSNFHDVNAPGASETDTYAVNNFGVIAGDYVDSNSIQHGMILNGSKLTTVDRPGCQTTPNSNSIAFYGLSTKLMAVGWCFDTTQQTNVGFVYNHGQFTLIAPPGSVSTMAQGINDQGQIVGVYIDASGSQHGFLLNGAKYSTLDVPGHTASNAWSINNHGLISIYAINNNGHFDSFLTNGKSYQQVNVKVSGLTVTDSIIHAINNPSSSDSADRVYTIIDSTGAEHGALFLKGKYYRFDDPKGKNTTRGDGLNDKLEIVGRYTPNVHRSPPAFSQGFKTYGCCR